jgi:uncharacterized membrane protein (DUF106 family)
MKKVILSTVMVFFLMSFTSITENKLNEEEIFPPECFDFADAITELTYYSPDEYLNEYNGWVGWYDLCEKGSNNDVFQFPPF